MELRPYQLEAIQGTRAEIRRGANRVLITCPTGGGKTVIASEIIRSAVEKGSRVLFLAHRRELISQTVDKLWRFGVQAGVIQAGIRPALHRPAQVASVQTLIRRPGQLSRVDLVFIDEAHHTTTGNTYAKLLGWWPQAITVGLTATPWRLDGRGLGDVFDGHVLARSPRELRDDGFLVPVGGWEYESIDVSHARVQRGDFVARDLVGGARKVVGNVVAEWLAHAGGVRTVVFCLDVQHSLSMRDAFRQAGVSAEHVDGETPAAERDGVLRRLASGEVQVVTNCNVLTEGWDCPAVECAVLARPTLSTALYLQMVGRVLRPAEGKAMARIHDHAGCLAAHGHPYAERDYSPTITARASKEAVKKPAKQKKCPQCGSVVSRWPCDACLYAPTAAELQLEFEEAAHKRAIERDGAAVPKREKPKESDEERRAKWRMRYSFDDDFSERRRFFERMAVKHGPTKGAWVYRWVSGNAERPRPEWIEEARAPGLELRSAG